jgi:hypothetical protein
MLFEKRHVEWIAGMFSAKAADAIEIVLSDVPLSLTESVLDNRRLVASIHSTFLYGLYGYSTRIIAQAIRGLKVFKYQTIV